MLDYKHPWEMLHIHPIDLWTISDGLAWKLEKNPETGRATLLYLLPVW